MPAAISYLANRFSATGRMTRRNFTSCLTSFLTSCLTMLGAARGVPASGFAAPFSRRGEEAIPDASAHVQSFRFENRRDLEQAASTLRRRFPGAVLLDAVVAAHVPELVVISADGEPSRYRSRFVHPVYEVRRYSEVVAGDEIGNSPLLQVQAGPGSVVIFGFESLGERTIVRDSASKHVALHAPCKVGFYRLLPVSPLGSA